VTVEVLYIADCPNYEAAASSVRDVLNRLSVTEEVLLTRISTAEEAKRERFLGSPTIRIDGRDVEPRAAGRVDFGIKCRLYRAGTTTLGVPPAAWIGAAIQDAIGSRRILNACGRATARSRGAAPPGGGGLRA
jgi:hypothetical protein